MCKGVNELLKENYKYKNHINKKILENIKFCVTFYINNNYQYKKQDDESPSFLLCLSLPMIL